jgi:hypothetical protein
MCPSARGRKGTFVAAAAMKEGSLMYPYGISVGGIVLLIVLVMLLTGRL